MKDGGQDADLTLALQATTSSVASYAVNLLVRIESRGLNGIDIAGAELIVFYPIGQRRDRVLCRKKELRRILFVPVGTTVR